MLLGIAIEDARGSLWPLGRRRTPTDGGVGWMREDTSPLYLVLLVILRIDYPRDRETRARPTIIVHFELLLEIAEIARQK